MPVVSNDVMILEALRMRIDREINEIIEGEAKQAQQRVVERIRARLDGIALSLLSEYSVTERSNELIITVRKPKK